MNQEPYEQVYIYFDGGANNQRANRFAYGSFEVVSVDGWRHKVIRQDFGVDITSNQAEYLAFAAALESLRSRVDPPLTELHIFSDSELLVNQLNGVYRIKHARIVPLAVRVQMELDLYRDWRIKWHSRLNNVKRFGH